MLFGRPFIAWPLHKDDRLHMAQEKGRLFAPAFRSIELQGFFRLVQSLSCFPG